VHNLSVIYGSNLLNLSAQLNNNYKNTNKNVTISKTFFKKYLNKALIYIQPPGSM